MPATQREILIEKVKKACKERQEIVLVLQGGLKSEPGYVQIMYGDVAFRFESASKANPLQPSIFVIMADIRDVQSADESLKLWR